MFVLFQVANSKGAIRSHDGCTYLKVIGFFQTKERALRYASKYDAEIRISPINAWNTLLDLPIDGITSHAPEEAHFNALMQAHESEGKAAEDRVKANVEAKTPGTISESTFFDVKSAEQGTIEDPVPSISVPAGQNVCLLGIVPDVLHYRMAQAELDAHVADAEKAFIQHRNASYKETGQTEFDRAQFMKEWSESRKFEERPGDQPLVYFFGVYETDAQAKAASDELKDFDTIPRACVSLGHFLKLREVHTVDTTRYYRDKNLQTLMDALKKAQKTSEA